MKFIERKFEAFYISTKYLYYNVQSRERRKSIAKCMNLGDKIDTNNTQITRTQVHT